MKTSRTNRTRMLALATVLAFASTALPASADPTQNPPSAAPESPASPPHAVPSAAPPPPPAAPPDALRPSPPGPSRRDVALAAVGVAAAAAVTATVFGVLALKTKSDYEKTPTYTNTANGNDFAAYSDGSIALAVAAGVTGLVLFLTNPTAADASTAAPKPTSTLSAAPVVMAHGAGAGAVLRF